MTKNDLQNTTQKTKDRATRTPLKTRDELRFSGMVNSKMMIMNLDQMTTGGIHDNGRLVFK
jgi:hypothetical protein